MGAVTILDFKGALKALRGLDGEIVTVGVAGGPDRQSPPFGAVEFTGRLKPSPGDRTRFRVVLDAGIGELRIGSLDIAPALFREAEMHGREWLTIDLGDVQVAVKVMED